jgi:hypothetical protein
MEVSGIEHLVAQMPQKHPSREVAMEGFGYEFVCAYFIQDSIFKIQNSKFKIPICQLNN